MLQSWVSMATEFLVTGFILNSHTVINFVYANIP